MTNREKEILGNSSSIDRKRHSQICFHFNKILFTISLLHDLLQ